ncbi:hypothetical protein GQR58_012494 [Nymphon striatum]|nr:hypothetical protein GQR58_012494 [Nymphon striatum]
MDENYRQVHDKFVKNVYNGTEDGGTSELFAILSLAFLPLISLPLLRELCAKCGFAIPLDHNSSYRENKMATSGINDITVSGRNRNRKVTRNLSLRSIKDTITQTMSSPLVCEENDTSKKLLFLTEYRSCIFFCTAISILAVDFNVFPRRFAKTETFGYSLMDCYVGSFILANALVAPEARNSFSARPGFRSVIKSVVSIIPLITLGFLRLISTSATNYHHQVSEYGVHWNFFFTLSAIKVVSSLLFCIFHPKYSGILSIIIILGVQYALLDQNFTDFLLYSEDRQGLISSNKEGLFSSIGFLALYFFGIKLGRIFFLCRDVMDAARDVMDAVRDVIPVACEALPSKMLLLLWLRSIPCFNATAATCEALTQHREMVKGCIFLNSSQLYDSHVPVSVTHIYTSMLSENC